MELYQTALKNWKECVASSSQVCTIILSYLSISKYIVICYGFQIVSEQLFNLLFFPGGWLVDHDNEDKKRHEHFELLRSICIPKVSNAYSYCFKQFKHL